MSPQRFGTWPRHFHVCSAALGKELLHHLEGKKTQQSQPSVASLGAPQLEKKLSLLIPLLGISAVQIDFVWFSGFACSSYISLGNGTSCCGHASGLLVTRYPPISSLQATALDWPWPAPIATPGLLQEDSPWDRAMALEPYSGSRWPPKARAQRRDLHLEE